MRCAQKFIIIFLYGIDTTPHVVLLFRIMKILLEALHNDKRNSYELTCAIIRRAYQITKTNEIVSEDKKVKPIVSALNQVVSEEVTYKLQSN